jgi:sugar lactone lactonase YvrE
MNHSIAHRALPLAALLVSATAAHADYTVHAVAGRGIGDGRLAVAASLDRPTGVTVLADGTILIADSQHHRIRRVDLATSVITTLAGTFEGTFGNGLPAAAAQLKVPVRVHVTQAGDLLIVDQGSNRIRRVQMATGIIEAWAGTGAAGYGGDGGLATAATLNRPNDVAEDAAGNVYIADFGNHVVRRVDPSGIITTVAGTGVEGFDGDGGPAVEAQLRFPSCVVLAPTGTLFICDKGNHRVRRIQAGIISTAAGNGNAGFTGDGTATAVPLREPEDATFDPTGRLVVSDLKNGRLRAIDLAAGTITTIASGLSEPSGVAVDGAGRLLFAERGAHRVAALASDGTITTVAGDGIARFGGDGGGRLDATLRQVKGVALDGAGNIFISDDGNNRIRRVDVATGLVATVAGNGTTAVAVDGVPATVVGLDAPSDVVVDAAGTMLIADTGHHRVRTVRPDGIIGTLAGTGEPGYAGDGGSATAAMLTRPTGLALDAAGNVYVADFGNHVIRRVTPAGTIETIAGTGTPGAEGDGGPAVAAQLNGPTDMTVDGAGNVFIADFQNQRVRRVDAGTGIITTVAGTGVAGSSDDFLPAVTAALNGPSDVVIDPNGNLLIADSRSNRIRRVSTVGVIDTVAGSRVPGGVGDGGSALDATFLTPLRLMATPDGRIFVSDENNSRVRLLVPDGVDPGLPPEGPMPPPEDPGGGGGGGGGGGNAGDSCRGTRKQCLVGGGSKKTDCYMEFWVDAPPTGKRNKAECKDGDDCDRDNEPGQCTIRMTACFNNADSRLAKCTPAPVTSVQLMRPKASSAKPGESDVAAKLVKALGGLAPGQVTGDVKPLVTFNRAVDTDTKCASSFTVTVPTRGRKKGKMKIAMKAFIDGRGARSRDVDKLTITCLP